MSIRQLISAAFHPGTSLKHHGERTMPVDALHALALAPERGAVLIHARQGQDNMPMLRAVVKQITAEIFAQRGWQIPHRRYTAEQRLDFFVEQVWREYMGEPCHRCKGHGYVGRKLDLVRHRLDSCRTCSSSGFVTVPTSALSIETKTPLLVRHVCPACRGKRLVEVVEALTAKRLRQCPECFGSGSVAASWRVRARAMRCSHTQVRREWLERFRAVLMTLREMERDAMIVCREQIYSE